MEVLKCPPENDMLPPPLPKKQSKEVKFLDFADVPTACEGAGKKCMKNLTDSMGSIRTIGLCKCQE